MERLQELLDILERDEESDEEEVSHDYLGYKLAAMECEKRFSEQRKLQHKMLLNKIEEIDYKLKQRNSVEKIEIVGSSLSGTVPNREKGSAAFSQSPRKIVYNYEGSLDKNFNYVPDVEDLDKSKELVETFTKLSDLKNQEKVLEEWYSTMSDQLQQEQMKLTDNFKDMKLKILQQKQHYLKASQEYINSLSNGSMIEEHSTMARGTIFDEDAVVGVNEIKIGTYDEDERNALGAQMKESIVSDHRHLKELYKGPHDGVDVVQSDQISALHFRDFDERVHGLSDAYPSNIISVGAYIESDLDVECQSTGEEKNRENSDDTMVPHMGVYQRLGAVARGYLTRKLMTTDTVLELIKTIKDTRAVLADMNKEDQKIHKKLHETKADELLKATVHQEMQNALNKFYAIFMACTPKEQMELIARSRTAAVDRRMKQYNKAKRSTLEQGKRLSTVTRKKLKKRQELLNDYCIARPQSSPSFTGDQGSRKQRKSWDIRVVQPVPSNSSPFHYARNRDRKVSQQVNEVAATEVHSPASQNEAPKGPAAKKGPRRKVIAATLNRKNESSNG